MKRHNDFMTLLFASVLLLSPAALTAAPADWTGIASMLNQQQGGSSSLTQEQRIALKARALMRSGQQAQAIALLSGHSGSPLYGLLKAEADRELTIAAVRKAGGSSREVHMQLPDGLDVAMHKLDMKLNQMLDERKNKRAAIQFVDAYAKTLNRQSVQQTAAPVAAQRVTKSASQSQQDWLMTALKQGDGVAKNMMPDQRGLLQVRLLLQMGKTEQARKLLALQPASHLVKLLKIEVDRQLTIATVRKAGGNRSEVHIQLPEDLAPALARLDARLNTLRQEMADQLMVVVNKAGVVKKNKALVAVHKPVSAEARSSILVALQAWSEAWSNRDIDAYFKAYADDMDVSARFSDVESWKAYKRYVISKRSFIDVRVENIEMAELEKGTLRIEFLQHFRSDAFNTDDRKALLFEQIGDVWKIIREESVI